jgi:hypothetical protein
MTAIAKALTNPKLLGAALGPARSWRTWLIILRAAFGETLTPAELKTFAQVAGGRKPPNERVRELWVAAGRRGGKSRIAAALAVFFGCFVKYKLAPGEVGMILVLAMSMDQAKVVFNFAVAFLQSSPLLKKEIVDVTRNEIRLRNGLVIATHSNNFRTVRGRTLCACIFDEVARWRSEESATPDVETYTAILPSLLTTRGMLVGISSPYRRMGLLFTKHRDHFARDSDDTLVVQATTLQLNLTLTETEIASQRAADPTASASEWDGIFRTDVGAYLDDELIDAAVNRSRPLELAPVRGAFYRSFTDPAGGVGADSYTLCIAHRENGRYIIDVVRGTPAGQRYDPHEVTTQYAQLLKEYGISSVTGDKYAREWVASAWRQNGITYITSPLAKPEIYLEVIPLFARGLVEMPDHPKLIRELRLLERIPSRSGRDSVDHPRGDHDDFANACAGAMRSLSGYLGHGYLDRGWLSNTDADGPPMPAAEQAAKAADEFQANRLAIRVVAMSNGMYWPSG